MEFTTRVLLRRVLLLGLPLVAVGWTGCGGAGTGGGCPNPPSCPATAVGAAVGVGTTPAGMMLNGVEAVLTGPVNVTMDCQTAYLGFRCSWPTPDVVAGTYSLQVSAPGYVTTTVQVVVAVDVPPTGPCGCSGDTIKPSTVSISLCRLPSCRPGPADGSVD
jgi:hypothetical protein